MSVKIDICMVLKAKNCCMGNVWFEVCDCMKKLQFKVHDCMRNARFKALSGGVGIGKGLIKKRL